MLQGRSLLDFGLLLAISATSACASPGGGGGEAYDVVVSAGAYDRRATPTSFELPDALRGRELRLRAEDGNTYPVQVDAEGRGHFILDRLPADAEVTLTLESAPGAGGPEVAALDRPGAVAFEVGGRPVLRYNADVTDPPRPDIDPVYARGGYIHPIMSPAGVMVSGDYPPDHLHHHGIWASWTRTLFQGEQVDFWNVADRQGDVVPVALDSTWSGRVFGGFKARHQYVALTDGQAQEALRETWAAKVYNVTGSSRPYWLFDLAVEQEMSTDEPLVLPQYHYGGVAYRGRDDWYGEENATFVTSEGRDRLDGNETRARWTHIGGTAEGGVRGVAVLSHPDNFRHPEPVRIHPREPYFVWAPSQLGEWSIQPGSPHRVVYRYVVHDGPVDAAELDRLWNDFAHPPEVRVVEE